MNEYMPESTPHRFPAVLVVAALVVGFVMGQVVTAHVYEARVKTWYDKAVKFGYSTAVYRAIAIKLTSKTGDTQDPEAVQAVDDFAAKIMTLLRQDEANAGR